MTKRLKCHFVEVVQSQLETLVRKTLDLANYCVSGLTVLIK